MVNSYLAQWGRLGSICSQCGDDMVLLGRELSRLKLTAIAEDLCDGINSHMSKIKVSTHWRA